MGMNEKETALKDLAVIGDRCTCAFISKRGGVVWYSPGRFDRPSLFAGLLDAEKGGVWSIGMQGLSFQKRSYDSDSFLLRTFFKGKAGTLRVEDWMPMDALFKGICRQLSEAPVPLQLQLHPMPDYGRTKGVLTKRGAAVSINGTQFLYGSHALHIDGAAIICRVPLGEQSWFVLCNQELEVNEQVLLQARKASSDRWKEISSHITYHGPYETEVRHSLRVLRLMTYAENGGIIAAGTTSLPEVLGGCRNYDYRFVWLRDAAMITSALTRAGSDGVEEQRFLDFICAAMQHIDEPTVPFFDLDHKPAPNEQKLTTLGGYANSLPIRIGNNANDQLQLDAISNVLLAAKLLYTHYETRAHWALVTMLADYLAAHWHEKDHGLWEETQLQHYTSSKVVAAVGLEYISEFSQDSEQRARWREAAAQIRNFVSEKCLTAAGAYAAYAGSEAVDVSAILIPIWGYTEADAPEVLRTVEVLERESCENNLYRRHLVDYDSRKEGAFLAGTFWVAQYWVMRRNEKKFKQIIEAALAFMNDVGLMPEEGDPSTGAFLGNIPQTFVHASLIGAVIDYKKFKET